MISVSFPIRIKNTNVVSGLLTQALIACKGRLRPNRIQIKPFELRGRYRRPGVDRVRAIIVIDAVFAILHRLGIATTCVDSVRRPANFVVASGCRRLTL